MGTTMPAADKPNPPSNDAIEAARHSEDAFTQAETLEKGHITSGILDESSPITYLYLTFDSDVPSPPSQPSSTPPPNLKAYTSPLTWKPAQKNLSLALGCLSTFLTAYLAGSYSPPSRLMASDFGTSQTIVLVGITTFCLGFSLAPMILAPVSEIWGRYPVFVAAGTVWVAFQAACALVTTIEGMLVCRFFIGCGASVFSSVFGGVLADLWRKEDRNTPMSFFSGAVLMGTAAGPLVTAGMVDVIDNGTTAWRWSFWHQVISDGALLVLLVFLFQETRASVLLSRKAKKLNQWYEALEKEGVYGVLVLDADLDHRVRASVSSQGSDSDNDTVQPANNSNDDTATTSTARSLRRLRWKVLADEERASISTLMATSAVRPFYMLGTEPVVFWFALWAAFAWGVLYLGFAVVSYLHLDNFGAAYRSYVAMIAGTIVATITGIWQERLLSHPQWRADTPEQYTSSKFWAFMRRRFPAEAPEARLYFACFTSLLLPAGLFAAFLAPQTGRDDDQGSVLAIGMGFATWGIYAVYLAAFNYLADTYHIYASSALASNGFSRNVIGGSFPVVTAPMFSNMGIKAAGGMLGGLGLALTLVPWVLVFFGARIRARSKMAIVSSSTMSPINQSINQRRCRFAYALQMLQK